MARETIFENVVLKMLNASTYDVINNLRILGLLKTAQECLTCYKNMYSSVRNLRRIYVLNFAFVLNFDQNIIGLK